MSKADEVWLELMRIGRAAGCHQMASRSFFAAGYQLPLCARCTGITIGYLAGAAAFVRKIRLPVPALLAMCIPCAVDGLLQKFTEYESNNIKRVITGFLTGAAYIQLLAGTGIFVWKWFASRMLK